ncbi:pitrilysin family protein [Propionicimonas sp.]|uniref:M16 family metallopeptidase n=1 Tax=Propionicimonas sp. TaxID=1955623 RepID=UPI0025DD3F24|nr:pitrilysin family protein [Propionicimonas sp.]MBU3977508.1 insulinase family protein [Actinomycetota bacterium]MBU3986018.1 insulinase family protein [Actinomycetota bacterium]MBU4008803.1 insulinase family protein [Actinomycetota bacterium]MBU4066047.1 insulinase family protein [Actinomycetota bacterium]MBU4093495.1 insulinase family protein [Actinomycetota bacterium]
MRRPEHRPEVGAPARWRFGEPDRLWLDNGLQVLVCHRPGQHVASVCLSVDIPLNAEPEQFEGVATIAQRCLDEGTAAHPGPSFAEALEDIGASLDGSVGYSASQLFLDVPMPRLGEALALLAEAVRTPELEAVEIERHCELRLAEIDHTLASSTRSAQLAFRKACLPKRFRASRMAAGSPESVAAITAAAVRRFHAQQYRPDATTLIITGDLGSGVLAAVEDAFADWSVPGDTSQEHQAPNRRRPHRWLIDRPGAVQADIRLGVFGIDRTDPRWADAQVAAHVVGGAFLSRLNRVLREERGFTYGVHLVNQPMRSGGLLAVQGSFRTEVVAEAVTLAAKLIDVRTNPITEAEVAEAVSYHLGSAPLRYSTAQGVTQHLAALVAAGLTAQFIDAHNLALAQVTATSATDALTELLPPDRLTLVAVGDAGALRGPLTDAGWPATEHRL